MPKAKNPMTTTETETRQQLAAAEARVEQLTSELRKAEG